MNKVITVNLNGNAYQLEDSGYNALRDYLDSAARRLEGNPDRDEIIADIEQAIAEKFRAVLGLHKTVVVAREVELIITEMGPVQDASGEAEASTASGPESSGPGAAHGPADAKAAGATGATSGATRRLYRINDGAMISGVCTGLAAHFNVDVTIIRVLFALLAFTWGAGLLLYLLMALIVPTASTPAEKTAAGGGPSTAEEFIRRARAGYYEGMKTWHDRHAHREWKRKFKQDMRGWKHNFQREMQGHANQWRYNWNLRWSHPPRPALGLPFLWLLHAGIVVLAILAALSLVHTGALWGLPLPAGVPLWVGLVGVFFTCHFLTLPLRGMRGGWYQGRSCGSGFFDTIVGLGFLVLMVWLADRYVPEVHEAIKQLPAYLHRAVDTVAAWFARQ